MRAKTVIAMAVLASGLTVSAARAQLSLPYENSVSEPGEAFRVDNTYTGAVRSYGGYFQAAGAEGRGVCGRVTSTVPDVNTYGGFFYAAGPKGRGVFGQSAGGQEGIGVKGWASNAGAVQNYGGHFCATGLWGIGVFGWAENQGNGRNYGGYFLAEGDRGVGVFAMGGLNGSAAEFEGDIKITGAGNGIVFPDGTEQTTACRPDGSGSNPDGACTCGCPAPAYDSGWVDLTFSKSKTLTHQVGGSLDSYTVDLQLKRNDIAGTQYLTTRNFGSDFYYDRLTTNTVTVFGPQQAGMDYQAWVRIRIWLCPSKPTGTTPK